MTDSASTGSAIEGRPQRRQPPRRPDPLRPAQPSARGHLGVHRHGALAILARRLAGRQIVVQRFVEPRAAGRRRAKAHGRPQLQRHAANGLRPAVVVGPLRVGQRAGGHGAGPFDRAVDGVDLDARVVAIAVEQWQPRLRLGTADRIDDEPAVTARAQQVVGGARHGVGPQRHEVLVGERLADHHVVVRVDGPPERAEGGRHAAHLDVEPPLGPGPKPHEQRVGREMLAMIEPQFGQQLQARRRAHFRRERDTEVAERAVFVIAVVEPAGILLADRRDHFAAEHHAAVGDRHRLGGQHLRGRTRGEQQAREQVEQGQRGHSRPV